MDLLSSVFLYSSGYQLPIECSFMFLVAEIPVQSEVTVPWTGEKLVLVVGVTNWRVERLAVRAEVALGFIALIRLEIEPH